MPKFTLRTINSTFFTELEQDRAHADDALAEVVRGALMIAADEVYAGAAAAMVEVIVEDEAGEQVRRSAVCVSVAALAIGAVDQRPPPLALNDD